MPVTSVDEFQRFIDDTESCAHNIINRQGGFLELSRHG